MSAGTGTGPSAAGAGSGTSVGSGVTAASSPGSAADRPFRLLLAGDRALVVEFGDAIDPRLAAQVRRLAARLAAAPLPGLVETVPTYRSLMIHYDPLAADPAVLLAAVSEAAAQVVAESAASARTGDAAALWNGARLVEIPVVYGGDTGPDLPYVAERTGLAPEEVVRLHAAPTYLVYMLGFLPGFPYLGGLDPRLTTPRLPTPRLKIPAGSVGIGGQQTGIYPVESPGGWAIIGRTSLTLFDPTRPDPCLLAPGDRVRFVPVAADAGAGAGAGSASARSPEWPADVPASPGAGRVREAAPLRERGKAELRARSGRVSPTERGREAEPRERDGEAGAPSCNGEVDPRERDGEVERRGRHARLRR